MLSFLLASLLSMGPTTPTVPPASAVFLQEAPASPAVLDYAAREKQAGDLEEFKGGGAVGLIVLIVVVVAVLVLVSILIPW